MRLEPSLRPTALPTGERGAALALLPIAATLDYYALPRWLQEQTLIQFAPQLISYLACALWASHNTGLISRFGLDAKKFVPGLRSGLLVGLGLGCLNSLMILYVFPSFGSDISFLKNTPHARLPVLVMVPWFIGVIAVFVEFNFRGFLLGRLLAMGQAMMGPNRSLVVSGFAIATSALLFSFDPFMTTTFRELHWIAVWDGVVWGACWIATKNLYVPIVAHAAEVIIMYSAVRATLL
ncbi:MAG TPA: CPBP family glutamic-type intramembrane protease [Nitrospira sp.]|nr:CPBP family glutamic-type intramembrane protease [Nitrospira sp.]